MVLIENSKEIFVTKMAENKSKKIKQCIESIKFSVININGFRKEYGLRQKDKTLFIKEDYVKFLGLHKDMGVGCDDIFIKKLLTLLVGLLESKNSINNLSLIQYSPTTKKSLILKPDYFDNIYDQKIFETIEEISGFFSKESFHNDMPLIIENEKIQDKKIESGFYEWHNNIN